MAGTLTVQNIEGPSSGANANTVLIPSGQELHAPGHVVQSHTHTWTTQTANATSSFADVGGSSFTFTPKFATSDLVLHYSCQYNVYSSSGDYAGGMIRFNIDGSTPDYTSQFYEFYYEPNGLSSGINVHNRVDKIIKISASSTSAKTIKLQSLKYGAGSVSLYVNSGAYYYSTIHVQEIAQ